MRGLDLHYQLEEQYGFDDSSNKMARGTFEIDHNKKELQLIHYKFTSTPSTDMEAFFRGKFDIPAHYRTKPELSKKTIEYCLCGTA